MRARIVEFIERGGQIFFARFSAIKCCVEKIGDCGGVESMSKRGRVRAAKFFPVELPGVHSGADFGHEIY